MPSLIEEYVQLREKKELKAQQTQVSEMNEDLLYEAREFLGFEITKTDPEFKAMKEKIQAKKKEERKTAKPSMKRLLKDKVMAAMREREAEK